MLCFAAEPPTPEFRTNLDLSGGFSIVQPDFTRSPDATRPTQNSVLNSQGERGGNGSEAVSFERSAIGTGGTVRFPSLAGSRTGQLNDSITLSDPIILRRPGQSDVVLDPNKTGESRWSPLLWYTIYHGTQLFGPAFGSGNTLYVAGNSTLPSSLTTVNPPNDIRQEGYVTAIRTDVDTANALPTTRAFTQNTANFTPQSVVLDAGRPWLRQLISIDYPRAANAFDAPPADLGRLYSNPYFVWPQNPRNSADRGQFTFDDFKIRVLQNVLPGSAVSGSGVGAYGVAGGDGTLLSWNNRGFYDFRSTDFWVADEGRIAKIDASGNVKFDSRVSFRLGVAGESNAGDVVPLVRPTRVIPVDGSDDLLVVDAGANKVLRMDPSGIVKREIATISLNPTFAPTGFRNNDPLALKNPRDVTTWSTRVAKADNPFVAATETNAPDLEEWVHYLIADQGNNRIVEVVDRIALTPDGQRRAYYGDPATLLWQSPANVSGKGYDYNSVSRVAIQDPVRGLRFVFVAGLGSTTPGRVDAGEIPPTSTTPGANAPSQGTRDAQGGGGVVVFDKNLPNGVQVFSSVTLPAVSATSLFSRQTGGFGTGTGRLRPGDPAQGDGGRRGDRAQVLGGELGHRDGSEHEPRPGDPADPRARDHGRGRDGGVRGDREPGERPGRSEPARAGGALDAPGGELRGDAPRGRPELRGASADHGLVARALRPGLRAAARRRERHPRERLHRPDAGRGDRRGSRRRADPLRRRGHADRRSDRRTRHAREPYARFQHPKP